MNKKTIGRKEIIEILSRGEGLSTPQASEVLESVLDTITYGLVKEGEVKIYSFGVFDVLSKKARIARNPKTKEEIMIESRRTISFRPSQLLKYQTEG